MTIDLHQQRILILDFGSQYTQLITRRVREIGIYCEIHPFHLSTEKIREFAPQGIILSGGPDSVLDQNAMRAAKIIFELGCPILGICYGMQYMAVELGGQVQKGARREYGYAAVKIKNASSLLNGIEDRVDTLDVWMSHGDHVSMLPPNFSLLTSSDDCEIVGMFDDVRHFYGLQFHPEVSHTRQGGRILERFLLDICQCKKNVDCAKHHRGIHSQY